MILAGDIGGTKTVVTLYDGSGHDLEQLVESVYPSRDFGSLEEILERFVAEEAPPPLEAACFGVAGPVIDGACTATNLPWEITESGLSALLSTPHVRLVNDLAAMAYGVLYLAPDEFETFNAGERPNRDGNIAVIAAGTGLGEAFLFWDGERYHPVGTEGGHAAFAPSTGKQEGLLHFLREKHGNHISYERILSGPGFANIYAYLRELAESAEPAWLTEAIKNGDRSAAIADAGLKERDPVCMETLEMFAVIYGSEAANLALKVMSIGGVVIGGGIAPKILPVLRNGAFMQGFTDKGRFSNLLRSFEVRVALNPRAPVIGAAHLGRQLALDRR